MDVAQRGQQLARDPLGVRRVTVLEPGGEVAALDVLHHQVRPLAGVEVVDGDEVRVLQTGGDLGLATEAAEVLLRPR